MPKEFRHIGKGTIETMTYNFLEAIGNLEAIQCPDLNETADAIESIGLKLRRETPGNGLMMFAKSIIDRALSANF